LSKGLFVISLAVARDTTRGGKGGHAVVSHVVAVGVMSGVVGRGQDDERLGAVGDRNLFSVFAVEFFSGQWHGCVFADVGEESDEGKIKED
jgi:hypothetical protein